MQDDDTSPSGAIDGNGDIAAGGDWTPPPRRPADDTGITGTRAGRSFRPAPATLPERRAPRDVRLRPLSASPSRRSRDATAPRPSSASPRRRLHAAAAFPSPSQVEGGLIRGARGARGAGRGAVRPSSASAAPGRRRDAPSVRRAQSAAPLLRPGNRKLVEIRLPGEDGETVQVDLSHVRIAPAHPAGAAGTASGLPWPTLA